MNHFLGAVVISRGYSPQRCRSCSRKVKHTRPLLLFHPVTDREISTGVGGWGGVGERGGPFRFKLCVRLPRYRPSSTDIFLSSRASRPSLCRDRGVHSACVMLGLRGGRGVLHLCGWRAGDGTNQGRRSSDLLCCVLLQLRICSVKPPLAALAAA